MGIHVRITREQAAWTIDHCQRVRAEPGRHLWSHINKIVQHADKLTQQTDKLIAESVGLWKLTEKLYWLTVALGAFACVQIVIMLFDYFKTK